ncbi:formate dehydrogenase subunit gamma [Alsobacter sp. SYSU M60028]|uniref:Formate dehydrogenase subunit gamma n=1 Tax=Alsobacter ponti TaxID=2962936 RepID=A0ABT1L942_9HYPH|nr:formate dehydrogenase subunit gamma [Alsobacter ponti]
MSPSNDTIERHAVSRYTTGARLNHWVTAISLILLALSGMALFTPSLFFLTGLFGGGTLTREIHPWIGVVLFFSFAGLFVRFVRLNLWNADDTRWMRNLGAVMRADEENVAEVGKYNAGQKLVFWGMSLLILVLITSGLAIWDEYFFAYTTIDQKRFAVLAHALAAVGAITIWIVHVYAAIWVRGTVRAMTRGTVTAGWAYRHHRKWLRQKAAEPAQRAPGA